MHQREHLAGAGDAVDNQHLVAEATPQGTGVSMTGISKVVTPV
ncbi:hypothetical protein [Streptomyces sp. NPDC048272]